MEQNHIFEGVKEILVDRFGLEAVDVKMDATLENDLGLDSMDAVDLLLAVNEAFGVRVSEQTLERIKTVSDLVDGINKCRPK